MRDQNRKILSQERIHREYDESDRKLKNINNKLQVVTNRLNDNFRRKIEDLNAKNVRTHEIKVKMDRYEEEAKEKHFVEYLQKQMEYLKRMKKLKKVKFLITL